MEGVGRVERRSSPLPIGVFSHKLSARMGGTAFAMPYRFGRPGWICPSNLLDVNQALRSLSHRSIGGPGGPRSRRLSTASAALSRMSYRPGVGGDVRVASAMALRPPESHRSFSGQERCSLPSLCTPNLSEYVTTEWSRLPDSHRHPPGTGRRRYCYAKAANGGSDGCCPRYAALTGPNVAVTPQNHWRPWQEFHLRPLPSQGSALCAELQGQMATTPGFKPGTSAFGEQRSCSLSYAVTPGARPHLRRWTPPAL